MAHLLLRVYAYLPLGFLVEALLFNLLIIRSRRAAAAEAQDQR